MLSMWSILHTCEKNAYFAIVRMGLNDVNWVLLIDGIVQTSYVFTNFAYFSVANRWLLKSQYMIF